MFMLQRLTSEKEKLIEQHDKLSSENDKLHERLHNLESPSSLMNGHATEVSLLVVF